MTLDPIPLDNVTALPIKPRVSPEEGAMLQPVPLTKCRHRMTAFEVDVDAAKCICKGCGEEVSPFFVLEQLMREESRWMQTQRQYQDEMRRLAERSRTKCQHCGQMTRISR